MSQAEDQSQAEHRLRDALRANRKLIPFVGSGLSLTATGNAACAGWAGLLRNGIQTCMQEIPRLQGAWGQREEEKLKAAEEAGDRSDYLNIAQGIRDKLEEIGEFNYWIRSTVGALAFKDSGEELVHAVRGLGNVIATTNYDSLIERVDPAWTPYDWDHEEFPAAFGREQVVLHLHGSAKNPDSVILGNVDYERHATELNHVLSNWLAASNVLVFIGCGAGLRDPHMAKVLDFMQRALAGKSGEHFILVTDEEHRELSEHRISPKIAPVKYGPDYDSLLPFLQGLNRDGEASVTTTPQVSPPSTSGRAGTGFLSSAAKAEEELNRAHHALQPVTEALRAVDDARAMPPGIDRRDLAEQEDKHRKLAAGLMVPAARLDNFSQQLFPRFQAAAECAWQAVRLNVSGRPERLTGIRGPVVRLETDASQLLADVADAVEDLERRITEYDPAYQEPGDKVSHAHTAIKRACAEIANLRTALDRHLKPEAGGPSAAPPDNPAPPPPGPAPSADDDSSGRPPLRLARVIGEARGGVPGGIGVPRPEMIPVPPGYNDRDEIFALRVSGYSMEKDGIVDGDYVTVLRTEDCQDGDLVAAVFGGEPDEAAVVKWLRRPKGRRPYLESPDPDDTARLKELGEFRVRGKVIGVVRWRITRLSERPPTTDDDEHAD